MRLLQTTSSNSSIIIQIHFPEEELGESKFCSNWNVQPARIADSSIAQDGVRSKDSFYPRCSVLLSSETWVAQATSILRTTSAKGERSHGAPPSCTRSTATRNGSPSYQWHGRWGPASIVSFAQWRGGNPSNYSENFLSYLWQPISLLLQLLPVGNGHNIQRESSLIL